MCSFSTMFIFVMPFRYTGILSKVLENTGILAYFVCAFSTMFIFVMPFSYC